MYKQLKGIGRLDRFRSSLGLSLRRENGEKNKTKEGSRTPLLRPCRCAEEQTYPIGVLDALGVPPEVSKRITPD
jgi:hypothetical protein